ncbi:hypothetical protein [Nocardia sp. CS682]|uniref:hypothetical protein n=1 Tax=Nocardia sp. CS682 TaxID=1047172 RepID=UPI00142FFA41|nr:hypothetical protein [Nocardia sp. CS682]
MTRRDHKLPTTALTVEAAKARVLRLNRPGYPQVGEHRHLAGSPANAEQRSNLA